MPVVRCIPYYSLPASHCVLAGKNSECFDNFLCILRIFLKKALISKWDLPRMSRLLGKPCGYDKTCVDCKLHPCLRFKFCKWWDGCGNLHMRRREARPKTPVSIPAHHSLHLLNQHLLPSSQCGPFITDVKQTVSTVPRSLVCDALPALIHPELTHWPPPPPFLPRHRPSVSDPKWNEAPYSPPHIERHDACTFHGVIKLTKPQATGNHTALFAATGCSSVPGWRQLRTLCTSRLAESYFRFALILLPSRA